MIALHTPLDDTVLKKLRVGDRVAVTGEIYVARDQAHKRLVSLINTGKKLPFNPAGQIVFYAGPTATPPGRPTGSIGPTTSYRMDPYTVPLLKLGLKGVIGKGERDPEVMAAFIRYKAVYFVAVGGVAALLSRQVVSSKVIAWPDLGAEAVRLLQVKDFPVIVAQDVRGRSVFSR